MAAGKGTRMKSKRPKVLHEICGRPMLQHVVEAARAAGHEPVAIVVGVGADQVRAAIGDGVTYVEQVEQLGTGHAVDQAREVLEGTAEHILVINGDLPLVRPETLKNLMQRHLETRAPITFLTCDDSSLDLGRVIRDDAGDVQDLVEQSDLPDEHRAVREINVGAYCFNAAWLWSHLGEVQPSKRGEVYLTSLIPMAYAMGTPAATMATAEPAEALGVDTRQRLAEAEAVMRERVRDRWMSAGVTLVDPQTIYIDADAEVGQDSVIHPNTTILGRSVIGEDCEIGPGSMIANSRIGQGCRVLASVIEDSVLERDVTAGPYSHLRNNTYIEAGTHLGNFVEIKKSRLGAGSKAHHFTYLGDATLGKNVNIGAGTITCNFDGENKNPTIIEDDAFIGCDTMLVAPIRVGANASTGAGAVVTKDVPPDSTAVGMPARMLPKRKRSKDAEESTGRDA